MSDKLILGDLKPWDAFIVFPMDGDNAGHGGYKGTHNLFVRIPEIDGDKPNEGGLNNVFSVLDTRYSMLPYSMEVIKVGVFRQEELMEGFLHSIQQGS